MDYYEAKRHARALLGEHADVEHLKGESKPLPIFSHRVGVHVKEKTGTRFVVVGIGPDFEAALLDAKTRQR